MIKKIKMLFTVLFSALALFVATAEPSYAGDEEKKVTSPQISVINTLNLIKSSALKVSEKLSEKALELLWGLALISLSFLAIKQIFSGADFNTLFAEIVKFIMTIGFFIFILNPKYIGIAKLIKFVEDWLNIIQTDGVPNHTPEQFIRNIFNSGWLVFCWVVSCGKDRLYLDFVWPGFSDLAQYIISIIVVSALFIVFICMTANFILTLVKAYITICCGVLAVGFGGLTWTNSWAVNYLKQLIKFGFELMCFVFIVDILLDMVKIPMNEAFRAERPLSLAETFVIFIEGLLTFILAHSVPSAITSMIEGGTSGFAMSAASQGAMAMKAAKATGVTGLAKLGAKGAGKAAKLGASSIYNRIKGSGKDASVDVKPNSSSSDSKE